MIPKRRQKIYLFSGAQPCQPTARESGFHCMSPVVASRFSSPCFPSAVHLDPSPGSEILPLWNCARRTFHTYQSRPTRTGCPLHVATTDCGADFQNLRRIHQQPKFREIYCPNLSLAIAFNHPSEARCNFSSWSVGAWLMGGGASYVAKPDNKLGVG
jgi:hypothetical protein